MGDAFCFCFSVLCYDDRNVVVFYIFFLKCCWSYMGFMCFKMKLFFLLFHRRDMISKLCVRRVVFFVLFYFLFRFMCIFFISKMEFCFLMVYLCMLDVGEFDIVIYIQFYVQIGVFEFSGDVMSVFVFHFGWLLIFVISFFKISLLIPLFSLVLFCVAWMDIDFVFDFES